MTNKQIKFVEYYLLDSNATEAYSKAYPGIKRTSCGASAETLLKNPEIIKLIKEGQEKLSEEMFVTKKDLIQDLIDIKKSNKDDSPKIAIRAIEVMGKMLGFFETKVDITSGGEKININLNLEDDSDN
jgi:phage terminase small subunit